MALGSAATQTYGAVRATMQQQGKDIGNPNALIAAQAPNINAILVTNDCAISQVHSVAIEDWTQPRVSP